jgi:RNA polymerase sporulation-specific sigma factor
MARHKVEICGVNTANIKVLTSSEMNVLFKKYQNGDKEAKNELIEGNLKLVLSILRKYTNRTDNMDDLFQVGCIGLIKAIDNFDLGHEVKFSTYAVPMILGEVKRYLRDNNSVRIARSIKDTSYKVSKLKEKLTLDLGREPSMKMLSDELGISEYEIVTALDSLKDSVSMFEPIYNDGGDVIYLCDQLEDKKGKNFSLEERISLNEALNLLKEKERYVINERYIYGKTQMELSDELGISQAQISRLEKSGLDHIKKKIL